MKHDEDIIRVGAYDYCVDSLTRHLSMHEFTDPELQLIWKAFHFAWGAHGEQRRKHSGAPYMIHPTHVACIVSKYFDTENPLGDDLFTIICAALLHDTVEDCDVSPDLIFMVFGGPVQRLVEEMTEPKEMYQELGLKRKEKKSREVLRWLDCSPSGMTIKLADIMSNTRSIRYQDPEFYLVYRAENDRLLTSLFAGNAGVYRRVSAAFKEMKETLD